MGGRGGEGGSRAKPGNQLVIYNSYSRAIFIRALKRAIIELPTSIIEKKLLTLD